VIKGLVLAGLVENIRVMSTFKYQSPEENDLPRQSRSHDLWYYERRADNKLYFRLAPLGWILLVIPAILAIGAIIILFLYNTGTPVPEPRITITPRDVSSDPPTKSVIKPAPPSSPPPRVPSRSNFNSINPIASPQTSRRPNGQ
jgi:hypothetical protein